MATMEIDLDDVAYYVDHALDAMIEILSMLGDELANDKPALPGANSPFQIVTHCLGVMEFWGGQRDRRSRRPPRPVGRVPGVGPRRRARRTGR